MPMHADERAATMAAGVSAARRTDAEGEQAVRVATGPAAATILAAGIGVFALGLCAILGDAISPLARVFTWWRPTGPLSGVTGYAVAIWLLSWWVLRRRWSSRQIELRTINIVAAALFVLGLLLSFPPFMDLLQGR